MRMASKTVNFVISLGLCKATYKIMLCEFQLRKAVGDHYVISGSQCTMIHIQGP